MDVLQTIKARRSVRRFLRKEIPGEILDTFVDAIMWAPSAGNLQSRKFYFVFDQQIKENLVVAAWGQNFIAEASLCIVGCADLRIRNHYGDRGSELYTIQDVSASIQNLLLEVQEQGLASVWVGAFQESEVSKILNLPNHLRPIAIVPIGYPAESPAPPGRVKKEEAVIMVS
ncbi:MAG: nitroreductase family protein [Candidatus Brocadiales bacterium]|jgi:nitroreductase